ncbi:MAG: hypothetical protein IJM75_08935 [Ruminococcus sp.]|nr:hypothetical protein [Ruminococcus sp.]
MNAEFEKYIEDLSPELQEKARQCKTKAELIQLAADEDLEVPMDALEGVAGGCGNQIPEGAYCADCGCTEIIFKKDQYNNMSFYACSKCGSTKIWK